MKKSLTLALFAALFSFGYGQPHIKEVSFPTAAHLFGLYEITFQLDDYSNPYDPGVIDVYAEFLSPEGKTFKVNAFYYEGYSFQKQSDYEIATATRDNGWRVRFTPNQAGTWTFSLHAIDRCGSTTYSVGNQKLFAYECTPVETAQGFIRQANTKYLKRESVENGRPTERSFYPIGPNVAWYSYKGSSSSPTGIYDYDYFIDKMSGNANFMRIWLSRYQYLSLYGPEYTQRVNNQPIVYFDSTLNQKDAAELDHIINYAAKNGITVMPCIFTYGDFGNLHHSESRWENNPYNTVLGLKSPTQFFSDAKAKAIAKYLIRYIVARWGYATNIVAWEFWNEVDNIDKGSLTTSEFHSMVVDWHEEMADYTRSIDPFGHPLTTSIASFKETEYLTQHLFKSLDIVQYHTYDNIQKAKSTEMRTKQLFRKYMTYRPLYPSKPIFCGEFGFGQSKPPKYQEKDPHGFDTHNCIWASLFSGSMGSASFWFWDYLSANDLLRIYAPVMAYCENLPRLSESYTPCTTVKNSLVCPNGIETYYLASPDDDTLYGWCQDTAFSYQALRRLTDKEGKNGHFDNDGVFDPDGYVYTLNSAKQPRPSSRSNEITLQVNSQRVGTQYAIRWFDGETGLEITEERATAVVRRKSLFQPKTITFEFPSSIRDVENQTVRTKFGDAAFIITVDKSTKNESNAKGTAPQKVKAIRVEHSPN